MMTKNHSQLGPAITSAVILVLFIYLAISSLVVSGSDGSTGPGTAIEAEDLTPSLENAPNQNDAQQIIALNVFGEARKEQPKQAVVVTKTRLNLKLLGILNSSDSEQSSIAIIADGSGSENAVRVGEAVPGDATLEEVHPTHIIIKRSGQLEQLDLEQTEVQLGRPLPTTPSTH